MQPQILQLELDMSSSTIPGKYLPVFLIFACFIAIHIKISKYITINPYSTKFPELQFYIY